MQANRTELGPCSIAVVVSKKDYNYFFKRNKGKKIQDTEKTPLFYAISVKVHYDEVKRKNHL